MENDQVLKALQDKHDEFHAKWGQATSLSEMQIIVEGHARVTKAILILEQKIKVPDQVVKEETGAAS